MSKQIFYFEMTDTFGGENNYSWIKRFAVSAKTLRGALIKLSKETGYNFRATNNIYYKAKNACIGLYELDHEIQTDWLERAVKL